MNILQVRPSREIPTKHSILLNCHFWYTLSVPTLYIPPLPTYVEEWFWEKTLATNLRVRDCYTHNSLHNPLWFFTQLIPLHFYILEKLIAQTFTTPILSVKWGFDAAGKHWKKPDFGECNRAYYGIQRARQDTIPRSLVRVGAWKAQVHWVD